MIYEPNAKHKPEPQPGRHGSICPRFEDGVAFDLLSAGLQVGKKRFASDGDRAFCAQCHDHGRDAWHGYPVTWAEVPPKVRHQLIKSGVVARRHVNRGLRYGK